MTDSFRRNLTGSLRDVLMVEKADRKVDEKGTEMEFVGEEEGPRTLCCSGPRNEVVAGVGGEGEPWPSGDTWRTYRFLASEGVRGFVK